MRTCLARRILFVVPSKYVWNGALNVSNLDRNKDYLQCRIDANYRFSRTFVAFKVVTKLFGKSIFSKMGTSIAGPGNSRGDMVGQDIRWMSPTVRFDAKFLLPHSLLV